MSPNHYLSTLIEILVNLASSHICCVSDSLIVPQRLASTNYRPMPIEERCHWQENEQRLKDLGRKVDQILEHAKIFISKFLLNCKSISSSFNRSILHVRDFMVVQLSVVKTC